MKKLTVVAIVILFSLSAYAAENQMTETDQGGILCELGHGNKILTNDTNQSLDMNQNQQVAPKASSAQTVSSIQSQVPDRN